MKYLGGKFRIAGQVSDYIKSVIEDGQPYWEPFVGAAWVLRRIKADRRYASDINHYLIGMWNALLLHGWTPPEHISEEEYVAIKETMGDYPEHLVAFVGFATSWGGKWFGGYARGAKDRNYAMEGSRSLARGVADISGTVFFTADFLVREPPESNMLIYCDPPYAGQTQYDYAPPFNHDLFWEQVRALEGQGHNVVVSEYQAPDDFTCVLEVSTKTDLRMANGEVEIRKERLFALNPRQEKSKQLTISFI